jgi:hypothetical protein
MQLVQHFHVLNLKLSHLSLQEKQRWPLVAGGKIMPCSLVHGIIITSSSLLLRKQGLSVGKSVFLHILHQLVLVFHGGQCVRRFRYFGSLDILQH